MAVDGLTPLQARRTMRRMESGLAAYLSPRLAGDGPVTIANLLRIPGGASRETWRFDAYWREGTVKREAALILRKDPPASLLETDREAEYAFYSSFAGTPVPVPTMRWLEPDASVLGGPFFIMDRLMTGETNTANLQLPRYDDARPAIARRMYEILGEIHTFDWTLAPLAKVTPIPTVETCWSKELGHWETVINENEISPQPIARAAIRWLRNNPPPPAQRVSVVHGDYRVGNFMYDTDRQIHAIFDWEMAHLGDPLEDLSWSCLENWQWARDGRPGGIVSREEATAIWETATGFKADSVAMAWWDVFNCVKAQGIWVTGAKSFQDGRSNELILAVVAYSLINRQDEILLRAMGRGA
jgi:aminoglycoside phosphotransferase (APT) family kinase protein